MGLKPSLAAGFGSGFGSDLLMMFPFYVRQLSGCLKKHGRICAGGIVAPQAGAGKGSLKTPACQKAA